MGFRNVPMLLRLTKLLFKGLTTNLSSQFTRSLHSFSNPCTNCCTWWRWNSPTCTHTTKCQCQNIILQPLPPGKDIETLPVVVLERVWTNISLFAIMHPTRWMNAFVLRYAIQAYHWGDNYLLLVFYNLTVVLSKYYYRTLVETAQTMATAWQVHWFWVVPLHFSLCFEQSVTVSEGRGMGLTHSNSSN